MRSALLFLPLLFLKGAVGGMIVSFGWMSFLGIGSTLKKNELPSQVLALTAFFNSTIDFQDQTSNEPLMCRGENWKDCDYPVLIQIFSMSYMWYPAVGCMVAIIFGMFFSFCNRFYRGPNYFTPVPSKLIIPLLLQLWQRLFPRSIYKVVSFSDGTSVDILTGKCVRHTPRIICCTRVHHIL